MVAVYGVSTYGTDSYGTPPAPIPPPHVSAQCPIYQERTSYISPDGTEYFFDQGWARSLISEEGLGTPPIEYVTQRGPFQHGESVQSYYLKPRTIQTIIRHNFKSRAEYWQGRRTLLNQLRPNRVDVFPVPPNPNGAFSLNGNTNVSRATSLGINPLGKYRKYTADGSIVQLDVLLSEGPNFAPQDPTVWDQWSFVETLRFIAHNPIWYSAAQNHVTYATTIPQLIFPVTFPIQFTSYSIQNAITYVGDWVEYPEIWIQGPCSSFTITNLSTGEHITVTANATSSQIIQIRLAYGTKTVELYDSSQQTYTNILSTVSSDSDLSSFHLAPAPEVANGINNIGINISGASSATSGTLYWYNRFFGI